MGIIMTQKTLTEAPALTLRDIKEFGSAAGPYVTIYLKLNVPGRAGRNLADRIRATAKTAAAKLSERGEVSALVERLTEGIGAIADQLQEEAQAETLLILRGDDYLQHRWLAQEFEDEIIVADNFHVRPLLKDLEVESEFYILALSQNDIRLLHCTRTSSEEVDLGGRVPRSLREHMATDTPQQGLEAHSSGHPGQANGTKGYPQTLNTDSEASSEYLAHFYKDVSRAVSDLLRAQGKEKVALVPCGVDYELALFGRVNTWPETVAEGVRGAANGLKGGEMHARALEVLDKDRESKIGEIVAQHDKQGGEIPTAGVNDIVKAAYEGRVLHLLVAENAPVMGNFDESAHRARTHQVPRSGDEDLINAAAVQTIIHAGTVHSVPQAIVPGNRPMAAVMRY